MCEGTFQNIHVRCDNQEFCISLGTKEETLISNSSLSNCTQFSNDTLLCTFCQIHIDSVRIIPSTNWLFSLFSIYVLVIVILLILNCAGSFCLGYLSSVKSLFVLFAMELFYPLPVSDDTKANWKVELIPIKFIAWEYAGCDTLWAGVITCLCEKLESRFGRYKTRYFRRIKEDYKQNVDPLVKDSKFYFPGYMRPYRYCLVPRFIWLLVLIQIILLAVIVIALNVDAHLSKNSAGLVETIVIGIVGSGAALTFLLSVTNLLLFLRKSTESYISKLQKQVARPNFKEELGFMHLVKQEVQFLNELIAFMENLERKKFRIVLLVDDLDRCESMKVLKMLEAISILLSEPKTRFISLIAVDPRVVVKSLEITVDVIMHDSRINGHEYLKKMIHLPFWLPEMSDRKVRKLVESYLPSGIPTNDSTLNSEQNSSNRNDITPMRSSQNSDRKHEKESKKETEQETPGKAKYAFEKALEEIYKKPELICHNPRSIKRICNILNMAMRLYVSKRTSASDQQIER